MSFFRTARRLPAFPAILALAFLGGCAPAKKFCPADFAVDFADALAFATMADLAYAPDTAVSRACGRDSCFFLRGPLTQSRAFVRIDDSARIQWIAFRGTETFADLKLDADYTHADDSVLHLRLHRGFAAATRDLFPLIHMHLRPGYRTRLAGHSLGGAVAVITGLYLRAGGFDVQVRTFGQPKVTNAAGALRADSLDLVRFLNGRDLVTQAPPLSYRPGKLGSYEHFGREVALLGGKEDKDGKGYECLQEHYRKRFDPDSWWDQAQEQALRDHGIANYVARLRALSPGAPGITALP